MKTVYTRFTLRFHAFLHRYGLATISTFLAILSGSILTWLLHPQGEFIVIQDMYILLMWASPLLILLYVSQRAWLNLPIHPLPRLIWPVIALAFILILFLFTGIFRHRWFYFLHWWPQVTGENLFRSTAFWFVFLTASLLPFFLVRNRYTAWLLGMGLIAAQSSILWRVVHGTGGKPISNDDHPSFIFRLWQFSETFPQLMTYNPYWNGGIAEHAHLATGAFAPGILLWPLWFFGDVPSVYTLGFGLIFIIIVPYIAFFSIKAVNGDRVAQWTAGILALGVSQHYFLWLMQYGTVGAVLVAAFILPVGALVYRIVCLDQRTFWTGFFLVASTCFLALYPPGAVMALPVLLTFLVNAPRWTWPKLRMLLWCALAVIIIHSRTFMTLLWHDDVFRFIDLSAAESAATQTVWNRETLRGGWMLLLAHLREGHPVLLFLGVLGAFFAPRNMIRTWYIPMMIGFALLTGWGVYFAPDLGVPRMAIPFLFAAIVPAALAVSSVLRTSELRTGIVRAALAALLLVTGMNTYRMYGGEGRARYHPIVPEMERIVEWIRSDIPEGGRFLFAGYTMHGYGGGHVAHLPAMTGREMMACDYYHFSPKEVEYDYPPAAWRSSPEQIFAFLHLYNVKAVSTVHASWGEHFHAHPEWYEEVMPLGESRLMFFRVKSDSSLFKLNKGQVQTHFNRLNVTLENEHEVAVIAYNWAKGLKASTPAELFPYDAGNGVTLIGIRPQGLRSIPIRY